MGIKSLFGLDKNKDVNGENSSNLSKIEDNVDMIEEKNNQEIELVNDEEKLIKNNENDCVLDITKKDIEKILNSNDIDKVKYLFLELSQLYFGYTPKVSIKGENTIDFVFEGFVFEKSISDIYLNIIKDFQDKINFKLSYSGLEFKDYNFSLEVDDYYKKYSIKLDGGLNENKLHFLKSLFEQYLLNNSYLHKNEDILNIEKIKQNLQKIENIDINLSSSRVDVIFKNEINEEVFNDFFIKIISSNKDYFTKKGILYNSIEILKKKFSEIKEISLSYGYDKNGKIYISLPDSFDSSFGYDILFPLIEKLANYKENDESEESIIENLKNIGTIVELSSDKVKTFNEILDKKGFVGYEDILEKIETNIILPWKDKENYMKKAEKISPKLVKDILPNAVLFYGAPGTGKTTISSAIGEYLNYPFVYLPVQKIMSKWYGESETKLDQIFDNVGKLGKIYNGVVFMIDEIDEIGKNREKSHEATAKLTGILLKKLDGLERLDNLLLIGATNLKNSLDDALLSRFSEDLEFRLPNKKEIKKIFNFYIPGIILSDSMLDKLENISGRDIKNISKQIIKLSIKKGKNIDEILFDYFRKY